MVAYDRLPARLRAWVRQAQLPWSPQSCQRIWSAARKALSSLLDDSAELYSSTRLSLPLLDDSAEL